MITAKDFQKAKQYRLIDETVLGTVAKEFIEKVCQKTPDFSPGMNGIGLL